MWRQLKCLLLLLFFPIAACITSIPKYPLTIRGGTSSTLDELDALVEDAVANNRKIVVVTGGVLSGIGKGVTASSIGVLFRAMGLRVVSIKKWSDCFDPKAHNETWRHSHGHVTCRLL
jgi:type IV secretory pathway TrbL component